MKYFTLTLIILVSFSACKKDNSSEEENITFIFQDGFETQNNSIDELFPLDGSRWTTIQQVNPLNATNEITIINNEFTEGQNALRLLAHPSDTQISKMDIEKNGLHIKSGDKVSISADFFIKGTQSIENLVLMDLESCSCWDSSVTENYGIENQCPGIRLKLSGTDNYLSIERGKIAGSTLHQTAVSFPRNQWVSVLWEMTLSDTEDGLNKLFINGIELLNENGMNMPNAQIFSNVFANQGINFTLQEPVFYERLQIGITANPTAENVELFIDNFLIKTE